MRITLILNGVKPISLNNSQRFNPRSNTRYKTGAAKVFESKVNLELRKFKNELNKFNKKYDENKHYVSAEYRFYMPIMTKDRETKTMRISQKSGDLSNLVKALEDIIFNQLHADDSCIASMTVYKIESKELRTEVEYTINDLHHIN